MTSQAVLVAGTIVLFAGTACAVLAIPLYVLAWRRDERLRAERVARWEQRVAREVVAEAEAVCRGAARR